MKMLTCSFLSGLFAATLLPVGAATVEPLSAAEAEKVTERIELLTDGNIAKHWYTWLKGEGRASDTNKVFTAEGSTLKVSGKVMGCVTTRKAYCDYRLSLEYRFVDNDVQFNKKDARDGGILFHSTGEDGVFWGAWMNSFECNIIQGATGDLIVVGDEKRKPGVYRCKGRVDPATKYADYLQQINNYVLLESNLPEGQKLLLEIPQEEYSRAYVRTLRRNGFVRLALTDAAYIAEDTTEPES